MDLKRRYLPVFVVAFLASGLRAELLPYWPVHWMCAEADGIVVGERIGANLVKVEEWLLPPTKGEPAGPKIEIVALDDHSRMIGAGRLVREDDGTVVHRPLRSRRLVCFLERKGVGWYSLSPGGSGSSGMVWIETDRCYRYQQLIDPGPYILAPDPNSSSEKVLREQIATGLADRRAWEKALEIVRPEEKAVVLASYLLTRTSPEEDRGTYLRRIRQVLPQLGTDAVVEVIALLREAQPGDDVTEAVMVLCDLGRQARPAVDLLLELLEQPEQVHPVRVLEALGRIEDASVAPRILPFLEHD
nr:hypothetical protein [Akkermansiaceae bacterium]